MFDDELLYDTMAPNFESAPTKHDESAIVPTFFGSKNAQLSSSHAEGFFESSSSSDLVSVASLGLISWLNDTVVMREINLNEQGMYVPDVSVYDYIARIARLAQIDPAVIPSAQMYLMRLLRLNPGLELDSVNVHRLVLIACMIAQKITTDVPFANSYWAKISGLFTLEEINAMEAEFIRLIQFDLSVSRDDYLMLVNRAKQIAASM